MHACAGPAVAPHAFPALWGTYGDFWPILSIGYARNFFYFRSGPRPGALFMGVLKYYNLTFGRALEISGRDLSVRRAVRVFGKQHL